MIALTRRRILSGALASAAFAGLSSRASPAEADIFGGDVGVLLAILTQSIAQAISLINLVTQTTYQVQMMTTLLRQAASGSFPALISLINTARYTYNNLTWGIRSMSYQMARIDSEYNSLFPSGPPRLSGTPGRAAPAVPGVGTRRSSAPRRWPRASRRASRTSTRRPRRRSRS